MPLVIDTEISSIVLEGGTEATINVEYHIIGDHTSTEAGDGYATDTEGFNFNWTRGLFSSFKFRQDPRVSNAGEGVGEFDLDESVYDIPLFDARVGTEDEWLDYVQDDRFYFRSVAGSTNANPETRGIGITNSRNAFLGILATNTQKVSLGRAGLHMVSDAIFATPLALAGINNDNAVEREVERDFCDNLKNFFNLASRDTTSNYTNGEGTAEGGIDDLLFEHFTVDNQQHKVMKYVYDQLRTQAPERFTQLHYNEYATPGERTFNVDGEGVATGSGQYDPFSQYEHFPFMKDDSFVMFMRPKIANINNITFGNDSTFAGGESNLVTIGGSGNDALDGEGNIGDNSDQPSYYTNADQYLVGLTNVDTTTGATTGGSLPQSSDNDGLLMAIELNINAHTVTDLLVDFIDA